MQDPMPNRFRRRISAWDDVFWAWDPESHAESHAKSVLAWESVFGVEFGVGLRFRRGIWRGIRYLAWDSAWDFTIGVGRRNPMPKFSVEDPLGSWARMLPNGYYLPEVGRV